MTRTLILMRHAKSAWDDPTQADIDRPLNARGRASAAAMGDWLRSTGALPDHALVSSATRTGETFERLKLDTPVTFSRHLYHANSDIMRRVLDSAPDDAGCVLMLGHNPGIADMAERLVTSPPNHVRFDDYPTGATLIVQFDVDRWNDIGWHKGQPIGFMIPRDLIG